MSDGPFLNEKHLPLTSLVVINYYRQSMQTITTNKLWMFTQC